MNKEARHALAEILFMCGVPRMGLTQGRWHCPYCGYLHTKEGLFDETPFDEPIRCKYCKNRCVRYSVLER